jgi:hypothetical protein
VRYCWRPLSRRPTKDLPPIQPFISQAEDKISCHKTVSSTAIFDDRPHLRTIETKIAMMFGKAFPSARQNVGVTNFSRSGRGNRAYSKGGGRSASARCR